MPRRVLCEFGEPEISDFGLSFVEEDVGYLEVPVDDILLREILESLEDVPDDWFGPVLLHPALLPQARLQVPFAAELGDDVAVPVAREDFEAPEDVGVVELFEYIDL